MSPDISKCSPGATPSLFLRTFLEALEPWLSLWLDCSLHPPSSTFTLAASSCPSESNLSVTFPDQPILYRVVSHSHSVLNCCLNTHRSLVSLLFNYLLTFCSHLQRLPGCRLLEGGHVHHFIDTWNGTWHIVDA